MHPKLFLPRPKEGSHKGQNGVILVIGGSRTYHGAPVLAALAAVRFCDLVYFSSIPENLAVLGKMKIASPNIIAVPGKKYKFALSHADCVLIGNGMETDSATKKAVSAILKTGKKCVVDAAALRCLPLSLLHKKVILTPHAREFEAAFHMKAGEKNAIAASEKYGCTILLKGKEDIVESPEGSAIVRGGNAGMTKGGTGDVLAGLVCAFYSQCESPLEAAYSASLLNKKAGDILHRAYGCNFSSEDLANELAFAATALC